MNAKTWGCGDCGSFYPTSVTRCTRPYDDYLSLRGGSVESAIQRAVDKAIQPLVDRAMLRLKPYPRWRIRWTSAAHAAAIGFVGAA